MNKLYHDDNLIILEELYETGYRFDLIYADCIYESKNFTWLYQAVELLKHNGIIIVQTDYHTVGSYKYLLDREEFTFVNWLIYKQEWGGVPRNRFPQKHDDILIYCNGDNWKWYGDRIQIPKVTAGTSLDKKGTGLKTPCSVFDDLGNFHTTSKERIKMDGKNVQWQKPIKLMNRLLLPFTDEGDTILDPFMGTGTTGVWCKQNNRNFVGIELKKEIYNAACERIDNE